jgi:small subunit ribosomal protein S8
MNDPIGDMLTRIRNARCAANPQWRRRLQKRRARVLDVLADEGYIRGYENTHW